MTVKKFDAVPTPSEALDLKGISEECIKLAWESYESKPEYKSFNKHDMIESIQIDNEMKLKNKSSN
ncbi:NF038105 family protein [Acinetobacter nectaris]|uniref:Uncharacterized protein n=1 Tax=Acinetobacter nectaris CIP 110549 TaxID=1392540 RepID=V2T5Z6_9GAMM|nr:NF038105 family protein [Acinetobacter nectaris]ESK37848.1 hypothetical protein P256_02284 [Acinetobacter nectaris CIP 110549]MCF8998906.1 NF038105 family protein [Acinetobacter nectaris]MCF9027501.1 NF038105 family protein [Acinetobacter nectaris]MCF9034902.1 NF038105 family protein [Acinetobacter nectaris]